MPRRKLPYGIPTVLRCLNKAQAQAAATAQPDRAINAEQVAALNVSVADSLLSRLRVASAALDAALAAQAPLTEQTATMADPLRMFVSHFHRVLDLGITRGKFPAGSRGYYGRDVHATTVPDLDSYEALAEEAQKISDGEAARHTAEGAGYVAMGLPSAVEVGEKQNEFANAWTISQTALAETNTAQEALQALLPEALALATDIYDTVEFFYRKDPDAASRREKCARWGVVYVYDAGEVAPVPEQADISNITTPGPGQVHFHYDAVNALTFDVLHKAPLATTFAKVADNVEAKLYQASGLVVGAHEFKVIGRNAAGDGPESAVAIVQVN